MSEAVGGATVADRRSERPIADLERDALVLIDEEQRSVNPNNALISVLCDTVRMCREYLDTVQANLHSHPVQGDGEDEERKTKRETEWL